LIIQQKRYTLLSVSEGRSGVSRPTDLVQGTVDLLILKTVAPQPMHGWAIAQRIKQVSNDVLKINQNALYPALHRLEEQGWLKSEWGESESNRRAKYYLLTKAGRKRLEDEVAQWRRLSSAIEVVVSMA
jgi:PadR family transcriptional regulator, regulatory protein PadR